MRLATHVSERLRSTAVLFKSKWRGPPNQCSPSPSPYGKFGRAPRAANFTIAPTRPAREPQQEQLRLYLPVHRCRYHWQHAIPAPWPDVNLPPCRHLNPDGVPVPAVPRSNRARLEEIRRRRAKLDPELRAHPDYAEDFPYWEPWFASKHEARQRQRLGPPVASLASARPVVV